MCFYLGEVSDIAYEDFGGVAEVDTEGTLNQALIIALTIMDSPCIMYTCIMIVATEVHISKSGFHL